MSFQNPAWRLKYDSSLRNYYYLNTTDGSVRFDNPLEVVLLKLSSDSAVSSATLGSPSSTITSQQKKNKFKLFKKMPKFSNLCNRSKSRNSNQSTSLHEGEVVENELHSVPMQKENTANLIQPFNNYGMDVKENQTKGNDNIENSHYDNDNDNDNDQNSLFSLESYVSSVNDSVINSNVNYFYNQQHYNKNQSQNNSNSINNTYSSSLSNKSLTIMNPDEFKDSLHADLNNYVRDNIDDYDDSEIQSLHDDHLYLGFDNNSSSGDTVDTNSEYEDESELFDLYYTPRSIHGHQKQKQEQQQQQQQQQQYDNQTLLSNQLNRELLRYEEDALVGY